MSHSKKRDKILSGPTNTGSLGTTTAAGITSASGHDAAEGRVDSSSLFLKFNNATSSSKLDKDKPSIPNTRNERYR